MKLMELLEQGKKATREEIEVKYVEANGDYIFTDNGSKVYPTFKDLTRNDWYEYEEYKTNFEFEGEKYYYTKRFDGEICGILCNNEIEHERMRKDYQLFPNEELANYIYKKQLLERKLMVFSYLNGANEIDWTDENSKKYYILSRKICDYSISFDVVNGYNCNNADYIYFKNEEACEKALELYEYEIKEVMEMKIRLGL